MTTTVAQRRRREGKTDYHARLRTLMSERPRLVARKSLHNIMAQIVVFGHTGDRVICGATSRELVAKGWHGSRKNIPAAYLTGLLLARKASSHNITQAILDIGLSRSVKGSKLFAVLAGALDGGLAIPHAKGVLPSQERIQGAHITGYAQLLKSSSPARFSRQFSQADPSSINKQFTTIKQAILSGA